LLLNKEAESSAITPRNVTCIGQQLSLLTMQVVLGRTNYLIIYNYLNINYHPIFEHSQCKFEPNKYTSLIEPC